MTARACLPTRLIGPIRLIVAIINAAKVAAANR